MARDWEQSKTVSDGQQVGITNVQAVSSYNLLDGKEPIMLVPGMPGAWNPPKVPVAIPPDTGLRFIDNNAGRVPGSPMEPLFRAVLHEHPDFDFSDLDIITDRYAISRLMSPRQACSVAAQVVGDTVIFVRREPEVQEDLDPNRFWGFRRNFEATYLKHRGDCDGSRSHHQIITYRFGQLRIMLRHAATGHFPEETHEVQMSDLTLLDTALPIRVGSVTIQPAGARLPRSCLFELSTSKVETVEKYMQNEVPEQWIAQTQRFIRAVPRYRYQKPVSSMRGRWLKDAMDIRHDAYKDIHEWEKTNQELVGQLHECLTDLVCQMRKARGQNGTAYFIFDISPGPEVSVQKVEATEMAGLPEDLLQRMQKRTADAGR